MRFYVYLMSVHLIIHRLLCDLGASCVLITPYILQAAGAHAPSRTVIIPHINQ
jgi:hypothetical protein